MGQLKVDKTWTLFLDRDGVINRRIIGGYITKPKYFEFLPFVIEGLKRLSIQFSRIFIVTNQQGVAKGIMSEDELKAVHHYMQTEFENNGIKVDKIYCATNISGAEGDRRKPNPAMALEAQVEFQNIDFKKAIFVGDTNSDIQFGMNLGMKTVWIKSDEKIDLNPDIIVQNLKELADELE